MMTEEHDMRLIDSIQSLECSQEIVDPLNGEQRSQFPGQKKKKEKAVTDEREEK